MKSTASFYSTPKASPIPATIELEGNSIAIAPFSGERLVWPVQATRLDRLEGSEKWRLFRNPDSPESLLISDPDFVNHVARIHTDWARDHRHSLKKKHSGSSVVLWSFLILLLLLGLFLWKGTPILADLVARQVPVSWELEMGEKISHSILSETPIDSTKTNRIREFYGRLIPTSTSHPEAGPIELFVLKKEEFNAFAIPGRKIFIYSGALSKIKTYPELMALIGHEAGHVEGRHSVRTLVRSASVFVLVSFFFGDLSGLAGVVADNARSLQELSYSRDFERDADRASAEFLCLNEVSQDGVVSLMQTMNRISGGQEEKGLSFLGSHPLTSERLENAKAQIRDHPCISKGENATLQTLFESIKK